MPSVPELTARSGIHHVTLITAHVQANVDFYAGFLGLRLVKRTGGYEDATQLHLFYGDALGLPGSLLTFIVWEDGASGRVGTGQVSEVALAVPPTSIGNWLTRALEHQVAVTGPSKEFGETVLRLKDPDGIIVKLVGVDLPAQAPFGDQDIAVRRLRGVTLLTDDPQATGTFIQRFGYRQSATAGNTQRFGSDTDVVDVRNASGYVPGIPGTGTADHVAFRAADVDAVEAMNASLSTLNSSETNVHDRQYFVSLYVREPGGTLIEYATDGPGLLIDESADKLGEQLFVPPQDAARADDLRALLPQFALPGEPRLPLRDLPFVHRFNHPGQPDQWTLVLLHGSGGNEADLMPLARRVAPHATLLGVRGRSTEEGTIRWFRHLTFKTFDQQDIASEAEAFVAFMEGARSAYGIEPDKTIFLGNSNGANFIAAIMALHPVIVRRAILLRAMAVLDDLPAVDLTGTSVLVIDGKDDPFGDPGLRLVRWLEESRAKLEHHVIPASHALTDDDGRLIGDWLQA